MNKLTFNILKPIFNRATQRKSLYHASILLLMSGLISTLSVQAQPSSKLEPKTRNIRSRSPVAVSLSNYPLQDGIHLFGLARTPEQLQTEYLVFKMHRKQVVGAFFMPSSSFDCFSGKLETSHLKLTVVESYEQQSYDHTVNLNRYHPIQKISDNDLRILSACTIAPGHTAAEPGS